MKTLVVSLSVRFAHLAGALSCFLLLSPTARADAISSWSETITRFASAPGAKRVEHFEARAHAIVHLALAEAAKDAAGLTRSRGDLDVAQRVAVAEAARTVVPEIWPAEREAVEALVTRQLATVPEGALKNRGLACGRAAAMRVMSGRVEDGWRELRTGDALSGLMPDMSEQAALAIARGASPPSSRWLVATPFFLKSARQIAAPVPVFIAMNGSARRNPALSDPRFFASVDRTQEADVLQQTWRESPVLAWNRIARALAQSRRLSLAEEARLFAVLNAALADAALTALHWRFDLGSWNFTLVESWADTRTSPMRSTEVTAPAVFDGIEQGTVQLEIRRVLVAPLPNYPSFAAALGGAATAAMAECLGGDRAGFTLEVPVDGSAPLQRSFGCVADAARECAFVATLDRRHTREACIGGHQLGAAVGREVARRFARAR